MFEARAMGPAATGGSAAVATPHVLPRAVVPGPRAASDAAAGVRVVASTARAEESAGSAGTSRHSVAGVADRASAQFAAIRDALGVLRGLDLCRLSEPEVLDLARAAEQVVRSMYGVQVRLAGEISERGIAATLSVRSAAHLLRETLTITIGDARARIAAAAAGLGSETPSGSVIEPSLPLLLEAVDAGTVSKEHCAVIIGCYDRIPDQIDDETRELCRDVLLDEAAHRDPNALRHVAEHIENIVIPDRLPPDTDPGPRAELHIGARRRDGLTPIRGLLSPLTAEQLRVAVEALSAPTPIDEHTPDPRPAALRREQALGEILHRHLTAGAGPRDGGVRPQVVVTIRHDELFPASRRRGPAGPGGNWDGAGARPAGGIDRDALSDKGSGGGPCGCAIAWGSRDGSRLGTAPGRGSAWSDYGGVQPLSLARTLACDAAIIPQVLGTDSVVLDQGRAVRLFTAEQRRAITTRDRGCAFPGCDIPPAWTDAHHITWWSKGGTTDVANGVLLCRRHHTVMHQGGWRIDTDPAGGRPWFIPPAHIDPGRQPRRNNHFRILELTNRRRR
ncbi:MAG: hypothetical protein BGO26_16070 [Actinobacteria bacterium 69-20]|nr:DUF222 domain-containing protein [Actinomycetota bacterium]OJV28802.1 MAG: hypothetical protein BGO26_16070 [Actinobacteria bacterium 69-20]